MLRENILTGRNPSGPTYGKRHAAPISQEGRSAPARPVIGRTQEDDEQRSKVLFNVRRNRILTILNGGTPYEDLTETQQGLISAWMVAGAKNPADALEDFRVGCP